MGRSLTQQLNGVVRQADKNLDPICVKVESEEVDARIRAVRHNRCRVPLRLALLSSGYVAITRRPTSEASYTTASVVVVVVAVAVGAVAVAVVAAAAVAAPPLRA